MLTIKRVYEPAGDGDGFRVLTDRLWPRGMSKEKAHLDVWLKEIAPSTELRKWFGHDPEKWDEFTRRYLDELQDNPAVDEMRGIIAKHKRVTLLYGAHDTEHNQAVVLRDFFAKPAKRRTRKNATAGAAV